MTTNNYRWTISAIGASAPRQGGDATTLTDTWTAALRAGRAALLSGELPDLAVSVNGHVEAILAPARDQGGAIDPAAVTADLLELHQGATAHLVTDLLTQPAASG